MEMVTAESTDALADQILRLLEEQDGKVQLKQRNRVCMRLKSMLGERRVNSVGQAIGRLRKWRRGVLGLERATGKLDGSLVFLKRRCLRQTFELLKEDSNHPPQPDVLSSQDNHRKIYSLVDLLQRLVTAKLRKTLVELGSGSEAKSEASKNQKSAMRLNEIAMASIINQLNQINHKIGCTHPEAGLISDDSRGSASKPRRSGIRDSSGPMTLIAPTFEWNTPGRDLPNSPTSRTQSFKEQNRHLARYLGSQRFASDVEESVVISALSASRTHIPKIRTQGYVSLRNIYF